MFFSFAHDQNQVIGHRNYISLDQLQHKTQLKIAVGMREHVLHSALVNYITINFQRKFKEACALQETRKIQYWDKQETGLFDLPDYMLYWMLSSDNLKVQDEHTVLSFIFHFTKIIELKKDRK